MAHNLNKAANGMHSVMVAGEPAWHRLGQHVKECQTWADAMRLANLDWSVGKEQLLDAYSKLIPAWGIFRQDNREFLGTVGEGYTPIQNVTMGQHIDATLGKIDGAHYESAGVLGKGERVWTMARIPRDIRIAGTDDVSKSYLLCTTSHDGTLSYQLKLTSVRVVCNNTLTRAISETGKSLKVRHTRAATERLDAVTKSVGAVIESIEELESRLNVLARRKLTADSFESCMKRLFGEDFNSSTRKENQILDIARLFESNDSNAIPEIRGTAYNLLNAITEYTDHHKTVRQINAALSVDQIRTQSALWGTGEAMKQKALDVILEETVDAPEKTITPVTRGGKNFAASILDKIAVN